MNWPSDSALSPPTRVLRIRWLRGADGVLISGGLSREGRRLRTLRSHSNFRLPSVNWSEAHCRGSPLSQEPADGVNYKRDEIRNQQQSEIHPNIEACVGGIVEERLNCCVNDTDKENWHDDDVLYYDEIVFLFAGAGLGHHEECEKEDEDDAYDENDVGCATEVVP